MGKFWSVLLIISAPQLCLVPFLKKSLPFLQQALAKGELTVEGIRPPSQVTRHLNLNLTPNP